MSMTDEVIHIYGSIRNPLSNAAVLALIKNTTRTLPIGTVIWVEGEALPDGMPGSWRRTESDYGAATAFLRTDQPKGAE